MNDIRKDSHEARLAGILGAEAARHNPPVFHAAAIAGLYALRRAHRTRATLAIAAVLAFAAVAGTTLALIPRSGGPDPGPVGSQPTVASSPTAAGSTPIQTSTSAATSATPGDSAPASATGTPAAAAPDVARHYLASAEADNQKLCGATFDGALFDNGDWPVTVTLFHGPNIDTQQEAVLTQKPDGSVSTSCRTFEGPALRFKDQASTLGAAVKAMQQSRPLPAGLPADILCPTAANPHPTAWVAWDSAAGTVVYGYRVTDDPAAAHIFQVGWTSATGAVTSTCP